MNRSDSARSRPRSTRTTAGLRLSYRTRPGTAPKYSNASTCPSRNASCAWVANATWNARPEHDSRSTNIHNFTSTPATMAAELAEVHLGLRARRMRLRHHNLDLVQAQLAAAPGGMPLPRPP